jgi:hypothetical protein
MWPPPSIAFYIDLLIESNEDSNGMWIESLININKDSNEMWPPNVSKRFETHVLFTILINNTQSVIQNKNIENSKTN